MTIPRSLFSAFSLRRTALRRAALRCAALLPAALLLPVGLLLPAGLAAQTQPPPGGTVAPARPTGDPVAPAIPPGDAIAPAIPTGGPVAPAIQPAAPAYFSQPFIRRSRDLDTSGGWIDHARASVLFHVRADGIYRISAAWLERAGVTPASLDPARIRLLRKGREVPMYAMGLEDGSFDAQDALYFFGESNYDEFGYLRLPTSPDDPYPQYFNKYSDSAAYWLEFSGVAGQRAVTAAPAPACSDTVDWAFECVHDEPESFLYATSTDVIRQNVCDWTSDKTWFAYWLQPGGIPSLRFAATRVKPGIGAKLRHKSGSWYSASSAAPKHRITIGLNGGAPIDSIQYGSNEQGLIMTRARPGEVTNGENRLDIRSVKLYEGVNQTFQDWWEVAYPRFLAPRRDSLSFVTDAEMGSGLRSLRIAPVSSAETLLLRVRAGAVARLATQRIGDSTLAVTDTLTEGTRYVLAGMDRIGEAPDGVLRTVPDLRSGKDQAGYLLITVRRFAAEAAEYARFIEGAYGATTRVVAVEDIYDNYSYGCFNPEAIKVFLYDAWCAWRSVPPAAVFLVGDACYNYKATTATYAENVVPSYGFPISDTWFAAFDSNALAPSLLVGRLPVRSADQIAAYREKHRAYLAMKPDVWNKTTLHFSGGLAANGQTQLDELRRINERVISEVVQPAPFGGQAVHFYKTITPMTDYGPYPSATVKEKIDEGGIIISYVGHSALRTWDNGIGDPKQLDNKHGYSSLVSDFGCSTAKFADADGASFAEDFVVPEGTQAIAYIGNAASGFTSTASVMPVLFYKALLQDGHRTLGEAHRVSKLEMARLYGTSVVNRVAIQSNVLVGDPLVRIAVADRPNLALRQEWVTPAADLFTDNLDSLGFTIVLANLGSVGSDSLAVTIEDVSRDSVLTALRLMRREPYLFDTLRIVFPNRHVAGTHLLRVRADADNRIAESDETDNALDYRFDVLSTYMQVANASLGVGSSGWNRAAILHPLLSPGEVQGIAIEFDHARDFPNPRVVHASYDRTVTFLDTLPLPRDGAKTWWRARLASQDAQYIGPFEFWNDSLRAPFAQRDSAAFATLQREGVAVTRDGCTPAARSRTLRIISSGGDDGSFGTIALDGGNILPTTFGRGYFVALIDSVSTEADTVAMFDTYDSAEQAKQLSAYIASLPFGKIIAVCTIDEPSANAIHVVDAMRSIGSALIDLVAVDSTGFRSSWSLIGRRGAAPGTVPEAFTRRFKGKAIVDTVYQLPPDTGIMLSPVIGPARQWTALRLERSPTATTTIETAVYGISAGGDRRLLTAAGNADTVSLRQIDAAIWPRLQVEARLIPVPGASLPLLRGWSLLYTHLPELAVNYQSVLLADDSVQQGATTTLRIGVVNAGESASQPARILVETDGPRGRAALADLSLPALAPGAWHDTSLAVQTTSMSGAWRLVTTVDPDDTVREQYENNNVFISRLVSIGDTVRPVFTVDFDGAEPPDRDYIRPDPVITMELSDASPLLVTGPEHFLITWNGNGIAPDSSMAFVPMTASAPARLTWQPLLTTGEHRFTFNATDASGNRAEEDDVVVTVLVDTEGKVANIYNFPNPFAGPTDFTFILTGSEPAERVEIKVYTVAGRLIRTLRAEKEQLRLGFNRLRWDGRDDDGSDIANGVYLYKFILRNGDASIETLGKVAKLR